ncbi:MAG: Mur ligase family protein, partial [Acidobacteriota bacterium]
MSLTLPISDRAWNKVVVYGLGASGMAASRLLRAHGVEVWACDRRAEVALAELADDPGVTIMLGIDPDTLPESIDAVVTSPGVPADRPLFTLAREAGIPVVAEVELAYHLLDGPVIGITGSNGKSTVTALTTTMLRAAGHDAASCGNFGEPLAAHALGPTGRTFVVELSSFQLETIEAFRPHAAAVLNLSPDHLDRHGSLEAYKAAKARILHQQTAT